MDELSLQRFRGSLGCTRAAGNKRGGLRTSAGFVAAIGKSMAGVIPGQGDIPSVIKKHEG